jgi:class 3 adenylate cyclase
VSSSPPGTGAGPQTGAGPRPGAGPPARPAFGEGAPAHQRLRPQAFPPQTQYARSGDLNLAYQVYGEGQTDVLLVPGWIWHVEHIWEDPSVARFFERVGSFVRLILFDRRGVGMSDRTAEPPGLAEECEDVCAVMQAAGSERAILFSFAGGAPLAVQVAVDRPEQVGGLIFWAPILRNTSAPDYDWTHTSEEREATFNELAAEWGTGTQGQRVAPSRGQDARFVDWFARLERLSVSPGTMLQFVRASQGHDVRDLLPRIDVPTLVMHRRDDTFIDVRHSRFAAEQVPGARYVELEGMDDLMTAGDTEPILEEIEEFITGGRRGAGPARALLTVVFTDVVEATRQAARLGDGRWRELLAAHDAAVRRELDRFGGHEVKTIGDSFLATFEGPPTRALRCACAIVESVREAGLEVRVGLHTGECEVIGEDIGGMAVHLASRIASIAGPGEVLASGTTAGAAIGSGLTFEGRGEHELKGIPFPWPLFALQE